MKSNARVAIYGLISFAGSSIFWLISDQSMKFANSFIIANRLKKVRHARIMITNTLLNIFILSP